MGQFDYFLNERITWYDTGQARWMWKASHRSHDLSIKLNEWPEEASYTVYVDGAEAYDLEEWPAAWVQIRKKDSSPGGSGTVGPPES